MDNVSRTQDLTQILGKAQPMIMKQNTQKQSDNMQQQRAPIGSYSSNNSYAEGSSPDRRTATPDLSHPYMHHTAQLASKKKSGTPGFKVKKMTSVIDNSSMAPSFKAALSTYNIQSGKIMGTRKLSSQQSRNQAIANKTAKSNQWIGHHPLIPTGGFSNIINNNIQGLSINYSNQIIQGNEPYNMMGQDQLTNNHHTEESDSSNQNSHRRCKSQNVKREKVDAPSQLGKKSFDRKHIQSTQKKSYIVQDLSQDDLLLNHINDALQQKSVIINNDQKFKSILPASSFEETASFDAKTIGIKSFIDSQGRSQDMLESSNHRRNPKKNGQSLTSHTLSGQATQKMRTGSNRIQHTQGVDEYTKNRFNQSYGGGANLVGGKIPSNNNSLTSGGAILHPRNTIYPPNQPGQTQPTSQSMEKNGIGRSRNKQIAQNNTVAFPNQYQAKFDGNLLDINFKTASSAQNQHQKSAQSSGATGYLLNQQKGNSSATNNSTYMNQANMQMLKQQILAHKKASNLLMKGISPMKKQ